MSVTSILNVVPADIAGMCLAARVFVLAQKYTQAHDILAEAKANTQRMADGDREMQYAASVLERIQTKISGARIGEDIKHILLDLQELSYHITTSKIPA